MKEDLDLRNHLSGLKRRYLRVEFFTINDLLHVRSEITPHITRNSIEKVLTETYSLWQTKNDGEDEEVEQQAVPETYKSPLAHIEDLREADVPFYVRTSIDLNIRVGFWYNITFVGGVATLTQRYALPGCLFAY